MAYDSSRSRVVLFGGTISSFGGPTPVDTWEWDGTTWTQASLIGPPRRQGAAMVYNARTQRVQLSGGGVGEFNTLPYNDLWEWDGTVWTQREPSVGGPLPTLEYSAAAFDTARSKFVVFGGRLSPQSQVASTLEITSGAPPAIAAYQTMQAVFPGQRATFFVIANTQASIGITYRWRRNGIPLFDGLRISGATTPALIIEGVQSSDLGLYDCVIGSSCGSITSPAAPLSYQCYANCDNSSISPVLNAGDFACFLSRFQQGCQ
jgi:hypothetical protein